MMALMFLIAFLAYLALSGAIAWAVARFARKRFKQSAWKFALPSFVFMLGLVFWDWPLMEVSYRYLCSTRAGFTQHKTVEQWKQENPGVWETLVPETLNHYPLGPREERYYMNQRFAWDTISRPREFYIVEREERIVDLVTGEMIARLIDYDTDIMALGLGRAARDYKFWMMKESCTEDEPWPKSQTEREKTPQEEMSKLKYHMKYREGHTQ